MKNEFFLFAQALDDGNSDHFQIGEKILSDSDEILIRSVTGMISEISRHGKCAIKDDGLEVIIADTGFLVALLTEQRDVAGRRASVVCCGQGDPSTDCREIIRAMARFAAAIGLTLDLDNVQRFEQFSRAKNNNRRPSLLIIGGAVLISAAFLVAALHFSQASHEEPNTTPPASAAKK